MKRTPRHRTPVWYVPDYQKPDYLYLYGEDNKLHIFCLGLFLMDFSYFSFLFNLFSILVHLAFAWHFHWSLSCLLAVFKCEYRGFWSFISCWFTCIFFRCGVNAVLLNQWWLNQSLIFSHYMKRSPLSLILE